MSKQWYILWNGQADKNHIGKPCMVHTPVVDTSKEEKRHAELLASCLARHTQPPHGATINGASHNGLPVARHWAQDIASWHVMPVPKGRGWRNPGYLYVIERDGTIYYCPETSLNQCHCQHAGNNRVSFGLSLVGDGTKQFPTMDQLSSLAKVMSAQQSKEIRYHRDFSPKECPGDFVINSITKSALAGLVKRYK